MSSIQTKSKLIENYISVAQKRANENEKNIKSTSKNNIRVVSYNVHSWKNVYNQDSSVDIIKTILKSNADILCLQEAEEKMLYSFIWPTLQTHGYNDLVYVRTCHYVGQMPFGNAIISKEKPIESSHKNLGYPDTNILSKTMQTIYNNATNWLGFQFEDRCVIRALYSNGLIVYCTHLDVFDETGQTRMHQAKQLLQYIQNSSSSLQTVVLCGDFNSVHESDYTKKQWEIIVEQDKIRSISTDCTVQQLLRTSKQIKLVQTIKNVNDDNIMSVWSNRLVDFFYVNPSKYANVIKSNIWYSTASDHFPISIDVVC